MKRSETMSKQGITSAPPANHNHDRWLRQQFATYQMKRRACLFCGTGAATTGMLYGYGPIIICGHQTCKALYRAYVAAIQQQTKTV